ncbi:MAG: glutamate racemase [Spirochaetes bacterium]|nr:glutamate racemase [Spirochaetota bacterium]
MNIAIFDSGIGGITFLKEAYKALPGENFIYYADTDNVPYGTKSRDEVKKFVFQAVDFMSGLDTKILVIACNSATSAAINDLRKNFRFPILGMEPAVKPAVENSKDKRILVLATTLTINEEKLNNLITNIDKNNIVDRIAMDRLVMFAENFIFSGNEIEKYIAKALSILNTGRYGTIVLGCTHFIYYKEIIRKLIPGNIQIIDGNTGTLNNMINIMKKDNLINRQNGRIDFYSSGRMDKLKRINKLMNLLQS